MKTALLRAVFALVVGYFASNNWFRFAEPFHVAVVWPVTRFNDMLMWFLAKAFAADTGALTSEVRCVTNTGLVTSEYGMYFMRQFRVRSFDPTGRMTSDLTGVEGHHFPATDSLEVKDPHMRSIDEQGRTTVATALRGVSNSDGSEIQLFGNAVVVRESMTGANGTVAPRVEFRGEYLHAFVNEDRVSSDKPVELLRGNDRFVGDQFEYDNRTGVAELKGRVRGVIQPSR